jgi:hypothetical protein
MSATFFVALLLAGSVGIGGDRWPLTRPLPGNNWLHIPRHGVAPYDLKRYLTGEER